MKKIVLFAAVCLAANAAFAQAANGGPEMKKVEAGIALYNLITGKDAVPPSEPIAKKDNSADKESAKQKQEVKTQKAAEPFIYGREGAMMRTGEGFAAFLTAKEEAKKKEEKKAEPKKETPKNTQVIIGGREGKAMAAGEAFFNLLSSYKKEQNKLEKEGKPTAKKKVNSEINKLYFGSRQPIQ
ncbi:hypothetical protein [Elusimicrobium minutum]|nr:hypothetical protein [Elusimicrobium minutum]